MTSQPGEQTIVMHILPNISGSTDNQTKKYGQLIECNKTKKFSGKIIHKIWWGNFSQTPF